LIRNYLKIAWRNLARNKVSSFINIGGLAIGMAVSFILLQYVYTEFRFDRFHANSDRIYQVYKNQPRNGEIVTKALSPQPLAATLIKDFPEIENTARVNEFKDILIRYQDKGLKVNTIAADPSLPDIFSFGFVYGYKRDALSDQSSIVLTLSAATAIFGDINPVGRVIRFNDQVPLTVSAVIKDHPVNSGFTFQAIISWQAYLSQQPWMKDVGWDNYSYLTYVLLKKDGDIRHVNAKIKNLVGEHYPADKDIKLFLYPFIHQHLYGDFSNGVNTGGRIEYVRLFLLLAIGILIIACINFMNLSTARSERRAREVGIRKSMGARRISLIKQFIGESLLMAFLAFILSLALMVLLLPVFRDMINIRLNLPYDNVQAWIIALTVTLFTGLIAGSYPAFFLSSFNPVKVLKGQLTKSRATVTPRRILVILQFTFAISLIVSSIFIYKQINYIKDRPVGYNLNGLIEMPAEGSMTDKFESFRQDAVTSGAISDGTLTSGAITTINSSTWEVIWPGQFPGEEKVPIDCIGVTYHFINTYQLELTQGRDFSKERPADSTAILLNEAAIKMMRLKNPLGQQIKWMGTNRTVIGVVKNFVWGSPYEPVKPAIIGFVEGWAGNIALRLNVNRSASKNLLSLQNIYKKYNPSYPFEFRFTDDIFSKKFQNEKLLGSMSISFTCLAIIISCLGLFGLASFSAGQRRKEISIRKVLGASTGNLWFKLSQEFVKLVIISFLMGSIVSWFAIDRWLNQYTYHTSLDLSVFIITLFGSIFICLMAVSWQAIKAALVNPVKNLRSE